MLTQEDMNVVCRSKLFEGYSPLDMASVLETFRVRRQTFVGGEVLTDESSEVSRLGLVVTGCLHVYDSAFNGRRHLVRIVSPGQVLGATLVATRRKSVPALVVAHGKGTVLTFSLASIRAAQTAGREPLFFENLNALVAEEMIASWRKISILSCPNIAERVLHHLRDRSEREGSSTIAIGSTESEFANYLGVNRAALSRVLGKLEAEGVFSHKRDVFTLNQAFFARCNNCNSTARRGLVQ